jgi:hypothetical protein
VAGGYCIEEYRFRNPSWNLRHQIEIIVNNELPNILLNFSFYWFSHYGPEEIISKSTCCVSKKKMWVLEQNRWNDSSASFVNLGSVLYLYEFVFSTMKSRQK